MKRTILSGVALAGIAFFATATAANASVTLTDSGVGFIGKGDVQNALGYNNAALQKAVDAKSLVFTAQVPTSRSLSQAVTQSGTQTGTLAATQVGTQTATQSGTQSVSQDLTCTYTNGNGTKVFHRDGVRDGDRDGTRTGSRQGTREGTRTGDRVGLRSGIQTGTQSGTLTTDLAVDARKTGQWTGFNAKGWAGAAVYAETGAPVWVDPPAFGDWTFGEYAFGEYAFGGGFSFGDWEFGDYTFESIDGTEWGAWDALPGENPDDCLRSSNAGHITQISNVITPGTVTDGAITEGTVTPGAVTPGTITDGAITANPYSLAGNVTNGPVITSGPTKVFVNGKAL